MNFWGKNPIRKRTHRQPVSGAGLLPELSPFSSPAPSPESSVSNPSPDCPKGNPLKDVLSVFGRSRFVGWDQRLISRAAPRLVV